MSTRSKPCFKIGRRAAQLMVGLSSCFAFEAAAREIQPMGKAVGDLLKTTKAFKKEIEGDTVFYSKTSTGKPDQAVVIEKSVWGTNCTHSWAIGIDVKKVEISDIKVLELSCPHADPITQASFLHQFKGMNPARASKVKLNAGVDAAAKATGSSDLTIGAVKKSLLIIGRTKGKF